MATLDTRLPLIPVEGVRRQGEAMNALFSSMQNAQNNTRQNELLKLNQARQENEKARLLMDQEAHNLNYDATTGGQIFTALSSLAPLDQQTRAATIERLKPVLGRHGFDDDDWPILATDEGLQHATQFFSRFKPIDPDAKSVSPSAVREFQFFNSLTPEQQQRYLTVKRADQIVDLGDIPGVVNPLNKSFNAITETPGTSQEDAQELISDQQAVKNAKSDAAKLAIKKSEQAFDSIAPIKQNISNYDEVIRLVDEGAETGVIASRFPSMKQASIELDNLQGKLGLDVIGNTTFGALSQSELSFALDTALPKKLKGPALKDWVRRKKAAQEKLLAYTQEAATFLGTPGNTISDWLALQKDRALERVPPQAIEMLRNDPGLKDFFFQKYGVLPDGF